MSHATTRRYSRANSADHAGNRRPVLIFVGVLIAIILTFYGIRIATDAPFLITGTEPEPEDFESRYVAHPWLAYLHMTPGVLYLLGAPLQLSQRIRTKHYTLHRRLGRVLVTAALVSVLFAFLFGLRFVGRHRRSSGYRRLRLLVPDLPPARRPRNPPRRRGQPSTLDDPRLRRRCRGRHCPHLDRHTPRPGYSTSPTASPQRFGLPSACT